MLNFRKKTATEKKPKKVTARQATHDFVNASLEFEKSRITDIENSRKTAWYVASGAMICALASTLAVVALTPLKTVEPYVVRVDNNTGQTDIITVLGEEKISKSDVLDKFFATQYVNMLESYDWYTISNNLDKVLLFSSSDVQKQVVNKFTYPNAPHKTLKQYGRINIKVNNTTILEKGLIQVRYTATTEPVSGYPYDPYKTIKVNAKNYLATIAFDYVNTPSVDEIRRTNPLGFTVLSYKVDEDDTVAVPTQTKTPNLIQKQPTQPQEIQGLPQPTTQPLPQQQAVASTPMPMPVENTAR